MEMDTFGRSSEFFQTMSGLYMEFGPAEWGHRDALKLAALE
jgi:hypothetical protein